MHNNFCFMTVIQRLGIGAELTKQKWVSIGETQTDERTSRWAVRGGRRDIWTSRRRVIKDYHAHAILQSTFTFTLTYAQLSRNLGGQFIYTTLLFEHWYHVIWKLSILLPISVLSRADIHIANVYELITILTFSSPMILTFDLVMSKWSTSKSHYQRLIYPLSANVVSPADLSKW